MKPGLSIATIALLVSIVLLNPSPATSAPLLAGTFASINFQPSQSPTYPGYLVDGGATYGARGNGYTYGWNSVVGTRDRNSSLSLDQRYDTFAIMANATWEMAVPNGSYTVRVVVGDSDWADVVSKLTVEGVLAVNGSTNNTTRWLEATVTVTVNDGKLTIGNLSGSYNKICFIDISSGASSPPPSNLPPTASITSPANGASFTAPANINISASASDSDGTVAKVEFFSGAVKLGEDLNGSDGWSFSWNSVASGSYSVTARATDNSGGATTSSAVNFTVMPPADTTPPVISATSSSNVTSSGATISWTTNEASDSQVDYGLTASYGSSTALNSGMVAAHSQALGGLVAGTTYHYRVKSRDAAGNLAMSGDFSFATTAALPPGTFANINFQPSQAPTYPGYLVDSGTTYGARGNGYTYGWSSFADTRDRNSSLSLDQRYDTFAIMGNATWEIAVPNGSYTVRVVVGDSDWADVVSKLTVEGVLAINGNTSSSTRWLEATVTVNVSDGKLTIGNLSGSYNKICFIDISAGSSTSSNLPPTVSITSPATGASFTAPANINIISSASDSDGTVAKVEFFTGAVKLGEDLNGSDGWSFNWNSVASGSYSLTARATDNSGGVTTSSAVNITVMPPADTTPPVISATSSSNVTSSGATISWTTNESADSQVEYGLSTAYGFLSGLNSALITAHSQAISGLQSGTVYNYRVKSRDAAGNLSVSGNLTFTTASLSASDGLVGYWKFDEGSGTGTFDSSGNGNNGTLVRGPLWTAGVSGPAALRFNGTDDGNDDNDPQVVIGRNFDVASLPFTMAAWVIPDDFGDWRAIFSKRDSTSAMRFEVGLKQGTGQVFVYTGGFVQFNNAPPLGVWTHIAVVATASDTRLYFNGVLQETSVYVVALGTSATANTAIGGTGEGTGGDNDPFKGIIDEVRVYNRALSAGEVQQISATSPVVILSVSAANVTTSGATINWNTSGVSDSQVQYGLTPAYGSQTALNSAMVMSHSETLSGLQNNTTYNYRVLSRDADGSLATSPNFTFRTPSLGPAFYSTNFVSTENPISEGGAWVAGKASGIDWNDPKTASGRAFASILSGATGSRYDDSVAHISASYQAFTANQYSQGTVYRAAGYSPYPAKHEVELLLRFQITPHNARGYEVLWGNDGGIAIVRWNGPLGNYTELTFTGPGAGVAVDGDVLRAEIIGNVIKVYKNGSFVGSATDSTWTQGQPGMGFWPVDTATPDAYGWKHFEAGGL